ncbi:hypothetical protein [Burkholderia ambifaria]|uniref:hypothetical protein n=1 Tax=Burkholderia ambifaria TaxID=152480 RepID=UPI00158E9A3D|nr:hypothetical protein [Burkholderia ambifaria]
MNSIGIAAWVAGLLGFALLVTGVAMISLPIGLIVAGILLLLWAFLADLAAARAARVAKSGE